MTGNPQEGDSAPGNGRDERELPELDDDALVRRLGEAIERYDPVPEWVLALGRDSYELHNLDVELALLDREPSTAGAIRSAGQT
jgi:hypothetical protein